MCSRTAAAGPAPPTLPADAKTTVLGVSFFDLSRMSAWADADEDVRIASFLQQFYELAAEHINPAGGRIVKFIGDAGLVVFDPDDGDAVILALCALARAARQRGADFGIDTWLNVSIHVGPVVAGSFGPPGQERFDVIGKTVNIAARLGRRGIVLSPQAFRCLSESSREQFEKYKPPITYRLRA